MAKCVLLGQRAGVGLGTGQVIHVCFPGAGSDGAAKSLRAFLQSQKASLGMPSVQERARNLFSLLNMSP